MISIPGYQTTYEILKSGTGRKAQEEDSVLFHVSGVVKETGKKLWSTKDKKYGQSPTHDKVLSNIRCTGQIGLAQCLLGVQAGEERKVTMPAHELRVPRTGYYISIDIPRDGTLEFTLEIIRYA